MDNKNGINEELDECTDIPEDESCDEDESYDEDWDWWNDLEFLRDCGLEERYWENYNRKKEGFDIEDLLE